MFGIYENEVIEKRAIKKDRLPTFITIALSVLIILVASLIVISILEKGDEQEQSVVGRFHNIGDAMGGMTAPLIGLISALLIYHSFRQQIIANRLVTETRREDNILVNLKDYLERLEEKCRGIEERLQGKTIKSFLDRSINTLPAFDRFYYERSLTSLTLQIEDIDARMKRLDIYRLLTTDSFIKEISLMVRFCNSYSNYLFDNLFDESLTPETKDTIKLYINEYLAFIELKFRDEIIAFSKLELPNFPKDVVGARVNQLVKLSQLFTFGTSELQSDVLKRQEKMTIELKREFQEKRMKWKNQLALLEEQQRLKLNQILGQRY